MQTPWDVPPPFERPEVAPESGPALQDVRIRFGVTLSCFDRAERFARAFRAAYPRGGASAVGDTAWLIHRCGALDAHEASLQAAAAIHVIAAHKLVRERPRAAYLHDFEVIGAVLAHERARLGRERDAALRQAIKWGLLRHPLVESVAAAQLIGRVSPSERQAPGHPAAGGAAVIGSAVGGPAVGGVAVGSAAAVHRAA